MDTTAAVPFPPAELLGFMGEDEAAAVKNGESLLRLADSLWPKDGLVLDVGCGYGRLAYALIGRAHQGKYVGMDILPAHIRWLSENLTPVAPNFSFKHLNIKNDRYNATARDEATSFEIDLPEPPKLILVLSVFTHLYETDMLHYLAQIARCMDKSSTLYATFFLTNPSQRGMDRRGLSPFPMQHELSPHCSTFNLEDPLHAISYDESWLRDRLDDLSLQPITVHYGSWCGRTNAPSYQDTMFLRKC